MSVLDDIINAVGGAVDIYETGRDIYDRVTGGTAGGPIGGDAPWAPEPYGQACPPGTACDGPSWGDLCLGSCDPIPGGLPDFDPSATCRRLGFERWDPVAARCVSGGAPIGPINGGGGVQPVAPVAATATGQPSRAAAG
jgi:hypothetical protein